MEGNGHGHPLPGGGAINTKVRVVILTMIVIGRHATLGCVVVVVVVGGGYGGVV